MNLCPVPRPVTIWVCFWLPYCNILPFQPHFTSELIPFPFFLCFFVLQSWLMGEKRNPRSLATALVFPSLPRQHFSRAIGLPMPLPPDSAKVLHCECACKRRARALEERIETGGNFCPRLFSAFFRCSCHPAPSQSVFSHRFMPTRW